MNQKHQLNTIYRSTKRKLSFNQKCIMNTRMCFNLLKLIKLFIFNFIHKIFTYWKLVEILWTENILLFSKQFFLRILISPGQLSSSLPSPQSSSPSHFHEPLIHLLFIRHMYSPPSHVDGSATKINKQTPKISNKACGQISKHSNKQNKQTWHTNSETRLGSIFYWQTSKNIKVSNLFEDIISNSDFQVHENNQ